MKNYLALKINKLTQEAGVYIFKDKQENILYIGKAKNLRKRVKDHFLKKSGHFLDFTPFVQDLDYIETDSEQDAFILEAQLINKYQPKYNIRFKDDKSYVYVAIAKHGWWRVYTTHQPKAEKGEKKIIGPYISSQELKLFLAKIRKILPFCSCLNLKKSSCLYADIGLCPAPFKKDFNPVLYQNILKTLETLLRLYRFGEKIRVEAYDASNISGTAAVGSMVVYQNDKIDKSQYRMFKIKTIQGQNDVASLREILFRRLKHKEWPMPDLIILDGGKAQLKAAAQIKIPTLALSKIDRSSGKLHSKFSKSSISLNSLPQLLKHILLNLRDEAHRFAITYHKKRRLKLIK